MDKKYKYLIIGGVSSFLFFGIIELLLYYGCTNNLACIVLLSVPIIPGVILGLEKYSLIVFSALIWFLIGALIGFLIYKFKKK